MLGTSKSISGFDPRSIPGCALWLDAADASTVTGTTTVTAWTDKSGSGNNAAFDTNKPSYTPANNYVETSNNNTHIRLPAAAFTNTTNQTCIIFIVYADKQTGTSTNPTQILFSTLDYGFYQFLSSPAANTRYNIRGNMSLDADYIAFKNRLATTNTVFHSIQYTAQVTNAANYFGAPYGNYWHPTAANSQQVTGDVYLGGMINADGDFHANLKIYEVLVYNNVVLTTAQRQSVEGYLAWKWGKQSSLPATHPFYSLPAFSRAFGPTDIPGCALWLDAADASTMNSTTTVTSWTDKSGLGNTMAGTATVLGSNMTFNGSTQAFSNTTFVFPSSNYSMFAVYSNTTAPASTAYMNVVYGSGGYPMVGVYDVNKYVSARSVVANTGALSPNVAASSTVLVSATYTPSTFSPFINGSVETTLAGTTLAATGIYVGGPTNYFNGSVSEILVYSSNLSTTQRQQVEGYLAAKWGLRSSVVSGHPFKSIPPSTSQPPQFQEVTPGNWKYDWQPYLQRLAAANNPTNATVIPTLSYGAAAPGGNGGVLGPNNCVYAVSSTNLMIYNIATNTTSSVTLSTAAGQRGGVLAPNGYLYFGGDSNILVVNPSNNSYSYINFTYTGGQTTAGGVLAPNGNIYYSTYYAARSMVVNTSNNTVSSITLPGGQGWIGACLAPNGLIYAVPYGATTSVLVINPNTNTYSNITPSLTPALSTQNYTGCVLGPNGLIYGIPYSASNILIINPATNSVTYGTGGPSLSPALSTQTMYCGVLAPNGNIYGMPIGGASNILIINTFTNAVSWGTGGSSLSPALSTQGYASAVLAPNGNIYGIPGGASNMLIISNTYAQLPSSNCCLSAFLNKY